MNNDAEYKITVPDGEYVVCDPCYSALPEIYERLIDDANLVTGPSGHTGKPDRECGFLYRDGDRLAAGYFTYDGDGAYPGVTDGDENDAKTLGVDSGMIGIVHKDFCDDGHIADMRGGYFVIDGPFEFERRKDGIIAIRELSGENPHVYEIHTNAGMTFDLENRYDVMRAEWISGNVPDGLFDRVFAEYREKGHGEPFDRWLEANGGFEGDIWPDFDDPDTDREGWHWEYESPGAGTCVERLLDDMGFESAMLFMCDCAMNGNDPLSDYRGHSPGM